MLRELDRNIWVAQQPLRYFGLSVGTRMTVIRLDNQELVVISPICPSNEMVHQLNQLGSVKHIIAPNLYHYLFADDFKAHYREATFWAAPGLKAKRPNLSIDRTIKNTSPLCVGLDHLIFDGFRTLGTSGFESLNECIFFHADSRTLVLTDAAFHFDESFPFVTQLATRVLGGYKSLSPSFLEKVATTKKEKVSQSIKEILSWDFDRVVMAHGSIIERDGKEKLREGYRTFLQ